MSRVFSAGLVSAQWRQLPASGRRTVTVNEMPITVVWETREAEFRDAMRLEAVLMPNRRCAPDGMRHQTQNPRLAKPRLLR